MNRAKRRAQETYQNKKQSNLRWVCNDHAEPTVENLIPKSKTENLEESLEDHMEWRSQFIVGKPMKTKMLSVNELITAGVVGLYTTDVASFQ